MIALESLLQSLPRLASTAALRCLIFAQGEWPAIGKKGESGVGGRSAWFLFRQSLGHFFLGRLFRLDFFLHGRRERLIFGFRARRLAYRLFFGRLDTRLASGLLEGRRGRLGLDL